MMIWFLILLLSTTGCGAGYFSARTQAHYSIQPDGTRVVDYDSTKEQQGLDLKLNEVDGKIVGVEIHVDKSSTAEQAIAAAAQVNLKMLDMIQQLTAQVAAMAAKGGK